MPSQYQPANGADPVPPWSIALLSQRDLSLAVPVNFVTQPAVSLTAACFAHRRYEDDAARSCLSNLLDAGFKRVVVDLYWDSGRGLWSLCPAEIPDSASDDDDATVSMVSSTSDASMSSVTGSVGSLVQRKETATSTSPSLHHPGGTQPTEDSSVSSNGLKAGPLVSSAAKIEQTSGGTLVQINPYTCSATLDVSVISGVIAGYLQATSNTLRASLLYLILNVHAASSDSSPTAPASAPAASALPSANTSLANELSNDLSSYLYTPTRLRQDRTDLNSSWYGDDITLGGRLNEAYFETTANSDGVLSTADGWPGEGFLEFGPGHYRLLASFGEIDPQMAQYDTEADSSIIFPQGTFEAVQEVSVNASGSLTSGCFFDENVAALADSTNSSWAISPDPQIPTSGSALSSNTSIESISNITACGISPLLNRTMSETADSAFLPYQAVAYNSIWSWASDEPRNVTDNVDNAVNLRCATMRVSSAGRWVLTDCTKAHRAACRVGSAPYQWRIGDSTNAYTDSAQTCPQNTSFDAPRTALENRYLFAALQASAAARPDAFDDADPRVWVNFNSLDVTDCWVVGTTTSCPYEDGESQDQNRLVIVPTVAAVIVFLLAAMTVLVKCAGNRQTSRRGRRRKGEGGWDYEGVPS